MTGKPALYALVGMQHRGTEQFVKDLPNGSGLRLLRDKDNRYDPNAVQVWYRDRHVGFISGKQVAPVAMAMDSAQQWERPAKLHRSADDRWPLVELE